MLGTECMYVPNIHMCGCIWSKKIIKVNEVIGWGPDMIGFVSL